jgi:hypothetical protein
MPTDTEFTLSLFDNTALSSRTHHTAQAVRGPSGIDQSDADDAGRTTTPQPADDRAPGGDRELARGPPAWARQH